MAIYRVRNTNELVKYIQRGFVLDIEQVYSTFNLSKTQYYDYVRPLVKQVKISKAVRQRIDISNADDMNTRYVLARVRELEVTTLINFHEVFVRLLSNDLLEFHQYDMVKGSYSSISKSSVIDNYEFMIQVLLTSRPRRTFRSYEIMNIDIPMNGNQKAIQARFYREIERYAHYKVLVCGLYCFAVTEDIEDKTPYALKMGKDGDRQAQEYLNLLSI